MMSTEIVSIRGRLTVNRFGSGTRVCPSCGQRPSPPCMVQITGEDLEGDATYVVMCFICFEYIATATARFAEEAAVMDAVLLSDSSRVLDGLSLMMEAALGPHDYVHGYVGVEVALLITEIAKLADDREAWFPRGKWATIQAIEERINLELYKCFKPEGRS